MRWLGSVSSQNWRTCGKWRVAGQQQQQLGASVVTPGLLPPDLLQMRSRRWGKKSMAELRRSPWAKFVPGRRRRSSEPRGSSVRRVTATCGMVIRPGLLRRIRPSGWSLRTGSCSLRRRNGTACNNNNNNSNRRSDSGRRVLASGRAGTVASSTRFSARCSGQILSVCPEELASRRLPDDLERGWRRCCLSPRSCGTSDVRLEHPRGHRRQQGQREDRRQDRRLRRLRAMSVGTPPTATR